MRAFLDDLQFADQLAFQDCRWPLSLFTRDLVRRCLTVYSYKARQLPFDIYPSSIRAYVVDGEMEVDLTRPGHYPLVACFSEDALHLFEGSKGYHAKSFEYARIPRERVEGVDLPSFTFLGQQILEASLRAQRLPSFT